MSSVPVSIVIPTYGRDSVLTDSISSLLSLDFPASEIIVVDQTLQHDSKSEALLSHWAETGSIRWIRLTEPSICKAMNIGVRESQNPFVLFLDDDIHPRSELVAAHYAAHESDSGLWASVGQVVQPWQEGEKLEAPRRLCGLKVDEDFPFHSTVSQAVFNVMAGNLCVNRDRALSIGGFDEQFQGAAYRFETEFARRLLAKGGRIDFLGDAGINHLRAERGGTRSAGSHLTSASPHHGVGDHYYALLHAPSRSEANRYCLRRIFREVRTRFHLTHPWYIPVKLVGEIRAYLLARRLIGAVATKVGDP